MLQQQTKQCTEVQGFSLQDSFSVTHIWLIICFCYGLFCLYCSRSQRLLVLLMRATQKKQDQKTT